MIETIKTKKTPNKNTPDNLAEILFNTLLHHDFSYLTQTQSQPYKSRIIEAINSAIIRNNPLPLYLDLGPGYHAALQKKDPRQLSFDVGLGELLVLYQMKRFVNRVSEVYPPGANFSIIIDNVCAVFVNDIDTHETEHYCGKFRELIRELNIQDEVKILVESEHFNTSDYDVKPISDEQIRSYQLTESEHENVERFLGHSCSPDDAIRRILIYRQIGDRTDELFYNFFKEGVHMTQRASKTTICFRPFPGGDSRIQSGKVVLGFNNKKRVYPFLMTSTNYEKYMCKEFAYPEILPETIREITFAQMKLPETGCSFKP